MVKYEKIFIDDSCPNCGANLIVTTTCGRANDTEFEQYYYNGDDVRCAAGCGFASSVSINEDGACAYIADGNLDELVERE
jgi:ribosomal protein S27AE